MHTHVSMNIGMAGVAAVVDGAGGVRRGVPNPAVHAAATRDQPRRPRARAPGDGAAIRTQCRRRHEPPGVRGLHGPLCLGVYLWMERKKDG